MWVLRCAAAPAAIDGGSAQHERRRRVVGVDFDAAQRRAGDRARSLRAVGVDRCVERSVPLSCGVAVAEQRSGWGHAERRMLMQAMARRKSAERGWSAHFTPSWQPIRRRLGARRCAAVHAERATQRASSSKLGLAELALHASAVAVEDHGERQRAALVAELRGQLGAVEPGQRRSESRPAARAGIRAPASGCRSPGRPPASPCAAMGAVEAVELAASP